MRGVALSTKRKILLTVLLAFVIGVGLRLFVPVGKPEVSFSAETIFTLGGYTVTNSLIMTVFVTITLIAVAFFATRRLRSGDEEALKNPRGLQNFMEVIVEQLYSTMESVNAKYVARFFTLVATIFFLVVTASWSGLIPGVGSFGLCVQGTHAAAAETTAEAPAAEAEHAEESTAPCADRKDGLTTFHPLLRAPSSDLNMTISLALISFCFTEFWGFRVLGFGYLKKFFVNPIKHGGISTFVGLIELISEVVRLISFSFRLFGNIFAGEVVLLVMAYLFPTLLSLPFYGLELFVGFIQAFVFSILTMVFMSMATESHDHSDEHAEHGVAAH
jgi:F-type H+-transporting ATPase subunit a